MSENITTSFAIRCRAVASMRQDEALASSRFYVKKILLEK